eukprot:5321927-Pyramimonas_sp.AAC.1
MCIRDRQSDGRNLPGYMPYLSSQAHFRLGAGLGSSVHCRRRHFGVGHSRQTFVDAGSRQPTGHGHEICRARGHGS